MRTSESYEALIQELHLAIRHVESAFDQYKDMKRRAGIIASEERDMATAALGYTLHNLYNAIENYFLRIAKFFENSLQQDAWHKDLVNRMAMELEGVRPALFSTEELHSFHELRAFRHVFRTIYDSRLDPRKVALAEENAEPAMQSLREAHTRYVHVLAEIRDGLSDPSDTDTR